MLCSVLGLLCLYHEVWELYFAPLSTDAQVCLGWPLPRRPAKPLVVCVVKALAGAGRLRHPGRFLAKLEGDYQAPEAQALSFAWSFPHFLFSFPRNVCSAALPGAWLCRGLLNFRTAPLVTDPEA